MRVLARKWTLKTWAGGLQGNIQPVKEAGLTTVLRKITIYKISMGKEWKIGPET